MARETTGKHTEKVWQTDKCKQRRGRDRQKKESQNISSTEEIISISNSGRQAVNERGQHICGRQKTD